MLLSLPSEGKAKHMFDQTFINNNPQYMTESAKNNYETRNPNYNRKDDRNGMNTKIDDLMFQRFEHPEMPSSIRVNDNIQNTHNIDRQQFNQSSNNFYQSHQAQSFQQPNNLEFNYSQSKRDLSNERMQGLSPLSRALSQPIKTLGNVDPASSFRSSYNDQYKSYTPQETPHPMSFNNVSNSNHQNPPNYEHSQNYQASDIYLPKINESSRVNYKEMHNERLQTLTPLSRNSALPNSDYLQSVQNNTSLIEQGRNAIHSNHSNRKEIDEQRKKEWERMSGNIIHIGKPQQIVVPDNKPIGTRQLY